ncbi:MAG: GntR family transcriptional regulator [Actinomycetota bacterium]|nr:GntR family transcriptional regulator [Acidimicrobiia bacterium]MDQ3147295.1 GntR family transcriptional regulator [Actinomycetota bacterium]
MTGRTTRYREIAADLRRRLASGELAGDGLLPSEAMLAGAYGASRVTVRTALESLREEGLVDARQGYGWFPVADPLQVSLGQLGTIEASVSSLGVRVERQVLDFAFLLPPPAEVAGLLGPGEVLQVRRLNLADGVPFARVTVWCPAILGAELSRAEVERTPFYELLPVTLGSATQTIAATGAERTDADALGVAEGSPVLRCWRTTTSEDGIPVLVSEHVFPGDRIEFVVELLRVEPSLGPAGIRLVEDGPEPTHGAAVN